MGKDSGLSLNASPEVSLAEKRRHFAALSEVSNLQAALANPMPVFSDYTRPNHCAAYSADGCGDFPKQWRMGRKRVEAFFLLDQT
jgi:hypothetical protein